MSEELYDKHVRSFMKTGTKLSLKSLPLVFAFQSHKSAHAMLVHTAAFGPKEGAAVWLDQTLDLQDLPLARKVIDANWEMFKDLLLGQKALCAQLPSGDVVRVGQDSFLVQFGADIGLSDKIVHITPYVVTGLWTFPDGRVKMTRKMTEDPYSSEEEDDVEWFIDDWYPAIGETRADWLEACERAGAFNDYGDP